MQHLKRGLICLKVGVSRKPISPYLPHRKGGVVFEEKKKMKGKKKKKRLNLKCFASLCSQYTSQVSSIPSDILIALPLCFMFA